MKEFVELRADYNRISRIIKYFLIKFYIASVVVKNFVGCPV